MNIKIFFVHEHHVVGGHHRETVFSGETHSFSDIVFLVFTAGADQFEVETVRKVGFKECHQAVQIFIVIFQQRLSDGPLPASGKGNYIFIQKRCIVTVSFGKPGQIHTGEKLIAV